MLRGGTCENVRVYVRKTYLDIEMQFSPSISYTLWTSNRTAQFEVCVFFFLLITSTVVVRIRFAWLFSSAFRSCNIAHCMLISVWNEIRATTTFMEMNHGHGLNVALAPFYGRTYNSVRHNTLLTQLRNKLINKIMFRTILA